MTIEEFLKDRGLENLIGKKVVKRSGQPFWNKLPYLTVKDILEPEAYLPRLGLTVKFREYMYSFEEDPKTLMGLEQVVPIENSTDV